MTVKQTPATPLPWAVAHGNAVQTSAESSGSKLRRFEPNYRRMDQAQRADAAYIVHAANAYPKLVEALARMAREADYVDLNILQSDLRGVRLLPEVSSARALLRELGEAS